MLNKIKAFVNQGEGFLFNLLVTLISVVLPIGFLICMFNFLSNI